MGFPFLLQPNLGYLPRPRRVDGENGSQETSDFPHCRSFDRLDSFHRLLLHGELRFQNRFALGRNRRIILFLIHPEQEFACRLCRILELPLEQSRSHDLVHNGDVLYRDVNRVDHLDSGFLPLRS